MKFNHGQPISEELSSYLKDYTDQNDAADVAQKTGVNISTILYLKRRTNTVTASNEIAVVELMKKAIEKADSRISSAKRCKKDVQKILDLV